MRQRSWTILGSIILIVALLGTMESYSIWHEPTHSSASTASSTPVSSVTLDVLVFDAITGSPINGASVYLNGKYQGTTNPYGYVLVGILYPPITQSYSVTAPGYLGVDGTWTVDPNNNLVTIRLTPAPPVPISESQLLTVWHPLITTKITRPVSYYLTLLRSNGTALYSQLASQIEELPNADNATAVAQIAFLALTSSNPDVKLGFEMMMSYGIPAFNEFGYPVPAWNVELLNLYNLANDVSFGKNDAIPLAIAIDDGIFTVTGDSNVQNQVRADDAAMLRLSREIMVWQSQHRMTLLLELPFEALLYWAWRGSTTTVSGEDGGPLPLVNYVKSKMPLSAYLWDTASPHTLEDMRADVDRLWAPASSTVDDIVQKVETYFYFPMYMHWEYHYDDGTTISVYGVKVTSGAVLNVNWQYYERFRKGLGGFGYCVAETAFVEAWLKSVGIPTDAIRRHPVSEAYLGHIHTIYYDPVAQVWKGYYQQVRLGIDNPTDMQWFQILKLPFDYVLDLNHWTQLNLDQLQVMFVKNGITTNQMQQWMS
jgi:hypothetical protein